MAKTTLLESPAVHRPRQQGKDRRAFGDPVSHDMAFNCLSCMYRPSCEDPNKNFNYRCTKWQALPDVGSLFSDAEQRVIVKKGPAFTPIQKIKQREVAELDLEAMVERALSSEYNVPGSLAIDDGDVEIPPNFYSWYTDVRYIGQPNINLWAMQLKMSAEYLGEYCPRCSDLKYLDDPKVKHNNGKFLERVQLLEHGVCPRCNATKSELSKTGELPNYYRMAAILGQRSGKNALATAISSYNLALWLKLPAPQAIFRQPQQQPFAATYVALTFAQAKKNYWDPFRAIIDHSAWFKGLHEVLDYYGERGGEELYNIGDIQLRYRHKNLFYYASGPNKRTLRGDTRCEASGDEFGWFPVADDQDDKERMGGPEIVKALQRSMKTLVAQHRKLLIKKGRNHLPKPIFTMISSPQEINDTIMTQFRASLNSPIIYGIQKATWEINPELPRKEFDEDFAEDADKAMRDFGAQPPLSSMAWIKDMANAVGVFNGKKNNTRLTQKRFINASGIKQTTGSVKTKLIQNGARVLALDAGYVSNSFSYAIGTIMDGIPIIEAVGEIVPNRKAPINFTHVYRDVISNLIRENGIQILVSDRWQNIRTHQDAEEDFGVLPVEYRLKYHEFEALREAIYNQEVVLPKLEDAPEKVVLMGAENYPDAFIGLPVMHLLYQILTVRDYPGRSVEKGGKTTDDIFRAVVLLYTILSDPDYASILTARANPRSGILGAFIAGGAPTSTALIGKIGGVFGKANARPQTSGSGSNTGAAGGMFSRTGGK